MSEMLSIGEAAKLLGVHKTTLRRWEDAGKINPVRTPGGQRRYTLRDLQIQQRRVQELTLKTFAYARVSSRDQKSDLARQVEMLSLYCAAKGWTFEVIEDLGSGINDRKPGLTRLLKAILNGEVGRLIIAHRDCLLRFGAELIFSICEQQGVEVVIVNHGDPPTFEEELARDVIEIIAVFSARLYGKRSRKNQQLIEQLEKVISDDHEPSDRTQPEQ